MPEDPFASIATPVQNDPFAAIAQPTGHSLDVAPESTAKKVGRGAVLGAFEGAGIAPSTTPLGVLRDTAKQLGKGVTGFVSDVYQRNKGFEKFGGPGDAAIATALDLIPAFIDRTATALESSGREAIAAGKQGDYEQAAEKGASTLTSAALLRSPTKAEEGLGAAGKLRMSVKDRFQPFARKVTQVEPAVKDAVTKTAEKQVEALADNRVKRTEAAQQGLKTQAAARTEIDRTKMAIGEKNKGIEAENLAQADKVARRGELAKSVDQQSLDLGKNLEKVEASVGKEANQKFDAVRGKLGISEGNPGPEVPPDQLVATVRDIEQNVLQGIPENVKEFRSILGHGEEAEPGMRESFTQATGKEPLGGLPFTWDKLQSLKSRLDTRLRSSRGMNGDLKRGLYQVRDAVVNTMGEIAEPAGAGETWADAKNFYRQYREDFHEPTGPSGSGSPVAQALDAVDPKNIRQPFLRTQSAIGNRGTEILRKYPQHGGNEAAAQAESLLAGHQEMSGLPEKASPKALKPVPEAFQLPEHKSLPKIPETPEVNINKAAKDAIATRAKNWGAFNARDVGILASSSIGGAIGSLFGGRGTFEGAVAGPIAYETGKFAMSRVLNNPKVINWLAKTPPEEVAAIQKIPGADKVRIVDGLTKAAIEGADQSQVIPGGKYESSFTKSARPETNPSRFNSKTSDYDAHLLTLKDAKGNRIGSVSWHPAPGESGVAEVHHSDLNPEYRGQGVGKEMYRQVVEDARRKGFKAIRADNEISPDAVRVWTSLGAKTVTDSLGRQRMQLDIPSVPPSISLSPEVRRLLGPANLARIAAVTGATQPKNPGEARDRVRQFATTP